jgi:hypothetical protein
LEKKNFEKFRIFFEKDNVYLEGNDKFLNGLDKGLRGLELVNDRLHMTFVYWVAIEEAAPLVWSDTEAGLCGYLNNLGVVFTPKGFVGAKLLLELHERRVAVSFGHL